MKKRSRLSILAGLSAAAGVKVSLLEALERIEAKGNLAQAIYPTETHRHRAASAQRMSRSARRRMRRYVAKRLRLPRLTRTGLSRSMISSAALRNRHPARWRDESSGDGSPISR
jgi:hypothetical protein